MPEVGVPVKLAASCLALLVIAPNIAGADSLGEAGAREMRRHAVRMAHPPSCLDTRRFKIRETTLRSPLTENTVPIPSPATRRHKDGHRGANGKVFVQAKVEQAGTVTEVKVTGVVGDPGPGSPGTRTSTAGHRFLPIQRRGITARATFDYCIAFRAALNKRCIARR